MGRFLAAGVITSICVRKRKDTYICDNIEIKDNREEIEKCLSNFINIDKCKISENDNYIFYEYNKKYFEDNIHQTYLKYYDVIGKYLYGHCLYERFFSNREEFENNRHKFNQKNCPIKMEIINDNKYIFTKGRNYVPGMDINMYNEDFEIFNPNNWVFYENQALDRKFYCDVKYFRILCNVEKHGGDSELLEQALNLLARTSLNNGLEKSVNFFISG